MRLRLFRITRPLRRLRIGAVISTISFLVLMKYAADREIFGREPERNAGCGDASDDVSKLCEHLRSSEQLGKPRGFIYYLTQSRRMKSLKESLSLLDANFNDKFQYPIVIFYEASDRNFSETAVRNLTRSSVFFQQIAFEMPAFINETKMRILNTGCPASFPVRYRHMCRFHSVRIYEQPIMQLPDVEYVLRLDDDSLIRRPIAYDIFDFVRRRRIQYAYILTDEETYDCERGLHSAVKFYIKNATVVPQFYRQLPETRMFYNNFELSAMAFWRSDEYRKFIRYIDELGGIYYHRWGDAPIKTLAVSLFLPLNQTHRFNEIGYKHQRHVNFGNESAVSLLV